MLPHQPECTTFRFSTVTIETNRFSQAAPLLTHAMDLVLDDNDTSIVAAVHDKSVPTV